MQTALRLLDREAMDKQRALDAALGQIERAFGKGSIMKLGSHEAAAETEVISTGSLGLDIALGIGGLPRGRVMAHDKSLISCSIGGPKGDYGLLREEFRQTIAALTRSRRQSHPSLWWRAASS